MSKSQTSDSDVVALAAADGGPTPEAVRAFIAKVCAAFWREVSIVRGNVIPVAAICSPWAIGGYMTLDGVARLGWTWFLLIVSVPHLFFRCRLRGTGADPMLVSLSLGFLQPLFCTYFCLFGAFCGTLTDSDGEVAIALLAFTISASLLVFFVLSTIVWVMVAERGWTGPSASETWWSLAEIIAIICCKNFLALMWKPFAVPSDVIFGLLVWFVPAYILLANFAGCHVESWKTADGVKLIKISLLAIFAAIGIPTAFLSLYLSEDLQNLDAVAKTIGANVGMGITFGAAVFFGFAFCKCVY